MEDPAKAVLTGKRLPMKINKLAVFIILLVVIGCGQEDVTDVFSATSIAGIELGEASRDPCDTV